MFKTISFLLVLCFLISSCENKRKRRKISGIAYNWDNFNLKLENESLSDTSLADYVPATPFQIAMVNNSTDSYTIEYRLEFGQCIGFCKVEEQLSSKGILSISFRWQDNFVKTEYSEIEISKYDELIQSLNFNKIQSFYENLGCGDCADGGGESITISYKGKSKTIGGTYGFKAEPVQQLLNFFRGVEN